MGGLSSTAIAEAGLALMEEAGEAGFTLRKLGTRLGCDPMSILYHLKSKDGLYRAMADRLESRLQPVPAGQPWRRRLGHLAGQYRALARGFPNSFWLVQRFLSTGMADFGRVETVLGALLEAGVPEREAPSVCLGFYAAVTGLAMSEIGGLIRPASAREAEDIARLPERTHPLVRRALPLYRALDPDSVFGLSIEMLLDGIAARGASDS